MNPFERKNTELIKEFNCYMREHPGFADSIPDVEINTYEIQVYRG